MSDDISFYRTELRVWQLTLSNEEFLDRVAKLISSQNAELEQTRLKLGLSEDQLRRQKLGMD